MVKRGVIMSERIFEIFIDGGYLRVERLQIPENKLKDEFNQLTWLYRQLELALEELNEIIQVHPDWKPQEEWE
jgi:hypothetical protein